MNFITSTGKSLAEYYLFVSSERFYDIMLLLLQMVSNVIVFYCFHDSECKNFWIHSKHENAVIIYFGWLFFINLISSLNLVFLKLYIRHRFKAICNYPMTKHERSECLGVLWYMHMRAQLPKNYPSTAVTKPLHSNPIKKLTIFV